MGAAVTSLLLFDPTAGEAPLLTVLEKAVGSRFNLVDPPSAAARVRAAGALASQRVAAVPGLSLSPSPSLSASPGLESPRRAALWYAVCARVPCPYDTPAR